MKNFSDGNTDGIIMVYQKEGKIYEVAFNKEELKMLDVIIPSVITKMSIVGDPLNLKVIK